MVNFQYYFDANALFKYYHDEKGDLKIRRLVSNSQKPILISSLTLLEYFNVVMQYRRKNIFKNKHINTVFNHLIKDARYNTTNRPFQIIPVSEEVFSVAQNILFHHARTFQIGSYDALHLAIFKQISSETSAILVTSDQSMQKVCEQISISFYDPEKE
ncbi:MAG: type II toxin-antitoxin system VapC family toxin [Thiomargarita sp.]|nr:type II toxin-antitoxin system VapC family toxin [Thiomargarita sp.]